MDFPGGAIKFASFNSTCDVNGVKCSDVSKGYILPTSYFGNVYNITAIEVVGVKSGQLAIDVSNFKSIHIFFIFGFSFHKLFNALNSHKKEY